MHGFYYLINAAPHPSPTSNGSEGEKAGHARSRAAARKLGARTVRLRPRSFSFSPWGACVVLLGG